MNRVCLDCNVDIGPRNSRRVRCDLHRAERKKEVEAAYLANNREKARLRASAWLAENPERAKETKAKRRIEQREHVLALEAAKRKARAEQRRVAAREYYWKNRERVLARLSSEEGRRYSRERMRRLMKDHSRRLHGNMSRAIRSALEGAKSGKGWESVVGYTRADLIAHIERQFTKGMGWRNMGEWEVDHIVPRCAFKLEGSDDPAFKACWAITNLRPLWRQDNRAKSGSRLHLV